jgi:hypothetical protein
MTMALLRNLEDDEWDVLAIMTDPVLLGEFLRNTADGSPTKEEWPKHQFKYRWYQKDLLTDQTEFISLVAGRAVGKCSPWAARIYTYPYGYVRLKDLLGGRMTRTVYAMNDQKQLVHSRMQIKSNGRRQVFRVTTKSGFEFDGTANHPILTPRGWVMISELLEDDEAAVMTMLPHNSMKSEFAWEELRWLGYAAGSKRVHAEMTYPLKFQAQVVEMQRIAEYMDTTFRRTHDGVYQLMRKRGPLPHYIKKLSRELDWRAIDTFGFIRIPHVVKAENLDQLRIFIESYFSLWGEFTNDYILVRHHHKTLLLDMQELLLRYGIESIITKIDEAEWELLINDYHDYYAFFQEFNLPGITVRNLKLPTKKITPLPFMRFEAIISIAPLSVQPTYAIMVHDLHNYISDGLIVHNSLVLEDRIIYKAVNVEDCFPMTKESTLVTANVSQMTPILDRLIMRLSNSFLLKDFLKGNINRSKGTMDFPLPGGSNYRINARIAGSKGENNMVGLHVPDITGDEMQIFPIAAFTQLGPTYNSWEPNAQQFFAGVPNGLREGNVLYLTDQRSPKFKKYRIPAHQNPFYTYQEDRENLLKYGGEDSDDYQHLVLGRHGEPAFSIIPRDKIITEPFEFWTHRYSQTDKHAGKHFKNVLQLHKLPASQTDTLVLAVDTGYADPTVAQVIGKDKNGVWRTFVRYRLTRIPFPEQADIIDWLDNFYGFNLICVDLGAGGGGIGVSQDLQSTRFSKSKRYDKRIYGVRFGDYIDNGETSGGTPLKTQAKSYAGQELARLITEGSMVFSEIDMEGVSQMERVAYQRRSDGTNQYFILSDRGTGKSGDDHIFASYVVFTLALLTALFERPKKKLVSPRWL